VNLVVLTGEQRQRAGAAESIVIGMGREDQNGLIATLFQLELRLPLCAGVATQQERSE
jgi:hypothetical protein